MVGMGEINIIEGAKMMLEKIKLIRKYKEYKENDVKYKGKHLDVSDVKKKTQGKAVYYCDGKEVGFIEFGYQNQESKKITINKLKVEEEYRGKQIGQKLVYYALESSSKLECCYVTASADAGKNALNQEQLVKFYNNFTFGRLSRKQLSVKEI